MFCRDDQAAAGERGRGAAAAPARAPRLDPPPGLVVYKNGRGVGMSTDVDLLRMRRAVFLSWRVPNIRLIITKHIASLSQLL